MLYIYYYHDRHGNFGDDLNPWMWPRLLPEIFSAERTYPAEGGRGLRDPILVGIGSILDSRIPPHVSKAVIGPGIGYADPPLIDDRWTIYAVRGPLTADRLNLDRRLAITDAAALLATLPLPDVEKRYRFSFIPHHWSTWITNWEQVCRPLGIQYIDPKAPVEQVLTRIRQSEVVIAEAMHGAVVADAFRVPWIPVVFHRHINAFKWKDWCASLSLDYAPMTARYPLRHHVDNPGIRIRVAEKLKLALVTRQLYAAKRKDPVLSSDGVFRNVRDGLSECVARFKKDVRAGRFDP